MSIPIAMLCIALAVVGSVVQSSIGIGFGLLATPILVMIDRDFVPAPVLIAVMPISIWVAVSSFRDIDHRAAAVATVGRVPGVALGALVAAAVSQRALAAVLAVVVLIAVGLSLWSPPVAVNTLNTAGAGAMSGLMGTTTGVGGPPMGLLYQRSNPRMVRATLAAFFTVGTLMSLGALALAGQVTLRGLRLALLLTPGVIIGLMIGPRAHRYLHGPRFRPVMLTACAASAVVLLTQQL